MDLVETLALVLFVDQLDAFENLVDRVYSVETISLASILDNIIYETIDVLKTDTQGNDLRVMKSAGEHFKER